MNDEFHFMVVLNHNLSDSLTTLILLLMTFNLVPLLLLQIVDLNTFHVQECRPYKVKVSKFVIYFQFFVLLIRIGCM